MTSYPLVSAHFSVASGYVQGDDAKPLAFVEDQSDDADLLATETEAEIFGQNTTRGAAWVQEAVQRRAAFAQRLPGTAQMTIGNGPGSLGNLTPEEAAEEEKQKQNDWADTVMGMVEREQERVQEEQRERERAEWAESVHNFAGRHWTGKQWSQAAKDLQKGGAGYDWLVSYLMQKGQTRAEAEKTADDMQLAASGMSKPEIDRTADEKTAMDRVDQNPVAADAFAHLEEAREADFRPVEADTRQTASTDRETSVSGGSDNLYDVFPSAPNLGEHHVAALAATEPLDKKAEPLKLAAITPSAPQPGGAAGLDI